MIRSQSNGELANVPSELRSPRAKLVYLYLSTGGPATVEEMQRELRMKKLALYSILKTLRRRALVEEHDGRYHLS